MNKIKRRILSVLLVFVLILSPAFTGVTAAADPSENESDSPGVFAEAEETVSENDAAPEEETEADEIPGKIAEKEPAPEGILEEADSSGTLSDTVSWDLSSSGVLTVYGSGDIPDYPSEYPSYYSQRDKISSIVIAWGITGIGEFAFWNLDNVTSVSISPDVTEIEKCAFQYCSSLKEVRIPKSVKIIGDGVFSRCSSLERIYFEGAAPSFGEGVFYDVTAQVIYFPIDGWTEGTLQDYEGNITWVPDNKIGDNVTWVFKNGTLTVSGTGDTYDFTEDHYPTYLCVWHDITTVLVKDGVTGIGEGLFRYCDHITKVTLPSGVTSIRASAFEFCESLPSITLPSGLKTIGNKAFICCYDLGQAAIPSGVTSIGEQAFYRCNKFQEITIPAGVKKIGDMAFAACKELKKITVNSANKQYASADGILFNKQKTQLLCYPSGKTNSSYTVPAGTEMIMRGGFYEARNLTEITIPDGVKLGGKEVFYGSQALKKITLPADLEEIPDETFAICRGLPEISIPKSVKKIGLWAFHADTSLKTIIFKSTPPVIDGMAFDEVKATAYYPEALFDLWQETVKTERAGYITWVAKHVDATGMKFKKTETEIPVGKTGTPVIQFTPDDAYVNLTWKSSSPGIASVDANGKVTAKKVGKTTISATGKIAGKETTIKCTVNVLFKDVTNKNYSPYTAIYALNAKGIVAGFSDGTFKPNDPVTRGQVLVFLWRSAGKPTPKSTTITFKDADAIKALGSQYVSAVLWGIEKGITEGFTDNTFRPNANCTRGQIVTFLWRYKGKPAPKTGYTGSFPDVPKKHSFYKAVSWAASYGITAGFSDGTFGPAKDCTRGQCVAFIYRMLK